MGEQLCVWFTGQQLNGINKPNNKSRATINSNIKTHCQETPVWYQQQHTNKPKWAEPNGSIHLPIQEVSKRNYTCNLGSRREGYVAGGLPYARTWTGAPVACSWSILSSYDSTKVGRDGKVSVMVAWLRAVEGWRHCRAEGRRTKQWLFEDG